VVSEQDVDQATSALQVAEAAVARARANLDYATLRAPFTGRVTARYVDEGALVAAATGSTSSVQPILDLADMDRVRVLTYVPQDDALAVREGDPATLQPGRDGEVQARVTRISRSLDPRTRTMLVEIDVANDPPRVYPGQFVPVELRISRHPLPTVPPAAVVFHGDAAAVGVIEAGRIRFVPVVLGEHDGPNLEVAKGLSGGETVALDAGGLSDGSPVRAVQASAAR
jgi:RND family efflux transporter MFP subunit